MMKAGSSETAEAPFIAYPSPRLILTFNGGDVRDSSRISPKLSDDKLVFSIKKAERPDSGDYLMTVENEFGKATLTIKVVVFGEQHFNDEFDDDINNNNNAYLIKCP